MSEFRTEKDTMGEVKVPAGALWGASTQRAVENFPISGFRFPRVFIESIGLVKWACAEANVELGLLDRKLGEKRIFPAIDVMRSGTRREELLLEEGTLKMVWTMRRMLSAVGTNEGIELLLNRLSKTDNNVQFLAGLTKTLDQ